MPTFVHVFLGGLLRLISRR